MSVLDPGSPQSAVMHIEIESMLSSVYIARKMLASFSQSPMHSTVRGSGLHSPLFPQV